MSRLDSSYACAYSAADLRILHRTALAALAEAYATTGRPPSPAVYRHDGPELWAERPDSMAPFACWCGAKFHVRRHLEAHDETCTERRL